VLIILSLAFLWSIPGTIAAPTLGNFVPKNFEVNAMAVSPHGDVAVGSFYAMDPTVIPWDLTKPIYKYTVVTLIVSNSNVTDLSSTVGINVPGTLPGILPFKVILIIQGVQINAPAIVSDIESVFGMPGGSFLTLTSNPVTLPVSVFGASVNSVSQYPGFVNAFVTATSGKSAVIGKYSASLLETSSSAIFFNSIESLTYPVSPLFGASGVSGLTSALFSTYFDDALGLNSTGVVVLHKNYFDFSQAADRTLSFNSFLGVPSITSATNETFATILPDGANVTSFSPSTMLVESTANIGNILSQSVPHVTAIVGLFPWLGSAQRLLPDVTVSFHYPAFDSPVLSASEATAPSPFSPGQNFTLALSITNSGVKDATDLHFTLDFAGVKTWNQTVPYNGNQLTFDVASLKVGTTDTTNFMFLSLAPDAPFILSATYLDSASFAYTWNTFFSLAANVKTNGPLTVTKTVNPTNPAYGQMGNVTVTITNNSPTQTFYNVVDTTPEAIPFLYGGSNPSNRACPYIPYGVQANTTQFTFEVLNNNCGPTVLTQVLVKHGGGTFQSVPTPNIPLYNGGQPWAPLQPYKYPGNAVLSAGENVTLQLGFNNYPPITQTFCCAYPGPLYYYYQENPSTTYLGVDCSPCEIAKGGTSVISARLVDAVGSPISGATVTILYSVNAFGHDASKFLVVSQTTDSLGQYSYDWTAASQLPAGTITLYANYLGSSPQYGVGLGTNQMAVINPTTINPNQIITLSYPYWFNVTGPLTIEPERIIYSSNANITVTVQPLTTQALLGEYVTQSNTVSGVVVGPASILPVATATMNATKLSFYYVAQNQTAVRINLSVTNTGSQTASNVVVTALIPRPYYNYYYGPGRWLPVVDHGTVTSVDNFQGTVSFSAGTLQPGQVASAWYVVKMNTTGLFTSYSNVTAQSPTGAQFKFTYTGPLLAGYPAFTKTSTPQPPQESLTTAITTSPSVIANDTQTTVTLHLYNTGNVTISSVNATLYGYNYYGSPQLTFAPAFLLLSGPIQPFTSQTVTFTATDHTSNAQLWTAQSGPINARVTYNQGSAVGYVSYANSNVLVYNSKTLNFQPTVKVDVSVGQENVTAGTAVVAVVTVTNTGLSPVKNVQINLQGIWPELTYGSTSLRWDVIRPGQTVKFRLGIQTRPGILYPVFVSNVYYDFFLPGSISPQGSSYLSASTSTQIRANDKTGPTVSAPWASPFAPTPTDGEKVWAMMSDPSAIGSADLDYYSNNNQAVTSIPMTSMIATYTSNGGALAGQILVGDIYNATIPAQSNGTIVFYRIRATDFLGNPTTGSWYTYNVLGFNPTQGTNSVVVTLPPGNNVQLNVSQYIPAVKATITLNLTTAVDIKVTQLSSSGATSIGAPSTPTGQKSLGIYLQIQTPIPITGISAVIRIYYNSTQIQGLNASTIVPYHWETGTSSWVALDNVQRNTSEMWVQGTATHFSLFAIFAASPAPPCTSNCTKPQPPQPPWLIIGIVAAVVVVAAVGGFYTTKMRRRGTSSTTETPTSTPPPTSGNPPAPASDLSSNG